jgi:chromosome segregation ATPase
MKLNDVDQQKKDINELYQHIDYSAHEMAKLYQRVENLCARLQENHQNNNQNNSLELEGYSKKLLESIETLEVKEKQVGKQFAALERKTKGIEEKIQQISLIEDKLVQYIDEIENISQQDSKQVQSNEITLIDASTDRKIVIRKDELKKIRSYMKKNTE